MNARSRFSSSVNSIDSILDLKNGQPPNEILAANSAQLQHLIIEHIQQQGGHIPFSDYMNFALYYKDLGYYSNPNIIQFGSQGDFLTAPLLSPLFSQCLAQECIPIIKNYSCGSILELGAGLGLMAADILLELEKQDALPKQYYIYEISEPLKKKQHETLSKHCKHLLPLVQWLEHLPTSPFKGVILANEFLDALPVNLFSIKQGSFFDRHVAYVNHQFQFLEFPCENRAITDISGIEGIEGIDGIAENTKNSMIQNILPSYFDDDSFIIENYTSEVNLSVNSWLQLLSQTLSEGVILFIDYGFPNKEYYHPDRTTGTLMCHYHHIAHTDPFFLPGLQDITAHVDFTSLARHAIHCGFELLGFTTQAHFLLGAGLVNLAIPFEDSCLNSLNQNKAINILTSPAEMGELFKVIAFGKGWEEELKGFSLNDFSYKL